MEAIQNICLKIQQTLIDLKAQDLEQLDKLTSAKNIIDAYRTIFESAKKIVDVQYLTQRNYLSKLNEFNEKLKMSLAMYLQAWKNELKFSELEKIFKNLEKIILSEIKYLSDTLRVTSQEGENLRKFYYSAKEKLFIKFVNDANLTTVFKRYDDLINEIVNAPFAIEKLTQVKSQFLQDHKNLQKNSEILPLSHAEVGQLIEKIINYLGLMILECHEKRTYYICFKFERGNENIFFEEKLTSKEKFADFFQRDMSLNIDIFSNISLNPKLSDHIYLGVLMPQQELMPVVHKLSAAIAADNQTARKLLHTLYPHAVKCHSIQFGNFLIEHHGRDAVEIIKLDENKK